MADPLPENPAASPKVGPGHPPVERQWQPGQSGNPGGRPKGLARKVREILSEHGAQDGEQIIRFWTGVLSGYVIFIDPDTGAVTREKVATSDRIAVSKMLAERGWGKPAEFMPIEDDDPLGLAEREADDLAAAFDQRLDELAAKRRRKTTPTRNGA